MAAVALVVGPVIGISTSAGTAQAQTRTGAVEANDQNKFEPATITVAVGGTVTWTNTGQGFHTVTGGENAQDPESPMNGTIASAGAKYQATFTKAGTYPYFCQPHVTLGMKGTVVVGAAGAPGGSPRPSVPNPGTAQASIGTGAPGNPQGSPSPSQSHEKNPVLEDLEAKKAAQEGPISGFLALTAGATAFVVVLFILVSLSTRTRPRATR